MKKLKYFVLMLVTRAVEFKFSDQKRYYPVQAIIV